MSHNDPLFHLVEIPLTDEDRAKGTVGRLMVDTAEYRAALAEITRLQVAHAKADIATKREALDRLHDAMQALNDRVARSFAAKEEEK